MPANIQHVYDAVKKAKETGEAWVTWGGKRMRLVPLTWKVEGCFDVPMADGKALDCGHFDAIVYSRKRPGGLTFAWIDSYKDVGDRIRIHEGGQFREQGRGPTRMGGWDQIIVVVTEYHDREGS